jgi:hypothetical protein
VVSLRTYRSQGAGVRCQESAVFVSLRRAKGVREHEPTAFEQKIAKGAKNCNRQLSYSSFVLGNSRKSRTKDEDDDEDDLQNSEGRVKGLRSKETATSAT